MFVQTLVFFYRNTCFFSDIQTHSFFTGTLAFFLIYRLIVFLQEHLPFFCYITHAFFTGTLAFFLLYKLIPFLQEHLPFFCYLCRNLAYGSSLRTVAICQNDQLREVHIT